MDDWIRIRTEKDMPEYNKRVLLNFKDGNVIIGGLVKHKTFEMSGEKYIDCWTDEKRNHLWVISEVIGWMPLPQPIMPE